MVTQIAVVVLVLADDGFADRFEKYLGAAAWPALCMVALVRASVVERPAEHMAAFGAIAVGCVIVATGFRPGLILGSSVERTGRVVRHLVVRKILGWLSLIPAVFLVSLYLESVGEGFW